MVKKYFDKIKNIAKITYPILTEYPHFFLLHINPIF